MPHLKLPQGLASANQSMRLLCPGQHAFEGGERGGNVRLTWRGPRQPPAPRGAWGRAVVGRARVIGRVALGASGRSTEGGICPTRDLARGARPQGQQVGPFEGPRKVSFAERPASSEVDGSPGAGPRGPASSRSVSSTGVSVGSASARVAPDSSSSSGGTSARTSGSAGSGSSDRDESSSSSGSPSPVTIPGRTSASTSGGASGRLASRSPGHSSDCGALPSAAEGPSKLARQSAGSPGS